MCLRIDKSYINTPFGFRPLRTVLDVSPLNKSHHTRKFNDGLAIARWSRLMWETQSEKATHTIKVWIEIFCFVDYSLNWNSINKSMHLATEKFIMLHQYDVAYENYIFLINEAGTLSVCGFPQIFSSQLQYFSPFFRYTHWAMPCSDALFLSNANVLKIHYQWILVEIQLNENPFSINITLVIQASDSMDCFFSPAGVVVFGRWLVRIARFCYWIV